MNHRLMKGYLKLTLILLTAISHLSPALSQTMFDEATYTPEGTLFKLNSAPKAKVKVLIYDELQGARYEVHALEYDGSCYKTYVSGDLKGKAYSFSVNGVLSPGASAKAVTVNGQRGVVLDLRDTDPEGWSEDYIAPIAREDWMIYELHHRDFSIHNSSGVPAEKRGKYLALAEPASINKLKALGVNAVHILPSFDFGSIDESSTAAQYNWGYDPQNYNVPEGSYSTDPADPLCRIREFKTMVKALHEAGIRVVLDVVYNHTYDIENSNFTRTYPGYFYRLNKRGKPNDGSGCGNETASEKELMRQYMLESVNYWVREFHIDGFRFDLMGIHDIETMQKIRASLPSEVLIYGEGWSAGACALDNSKLAMKANMKQLPGIAAFSDDLRDALRGPFSDDTKGAFLAGLPGEEESIKAGIVGLIEHQGVNYSKVNYSTEPWANEPTQCLNYVSCHDDMCLVDRLRTSIKGISEDELIRLDELAQTVVFTSQGIPFMQAGEEVLRDKKGVHNSYCSPDSVNAIDWSGAERYPQLYNYYCQLTRLRASHKAFRLGSAEEVQKRITFLPTDDCFVGYIIDCEGLIDEEWDKVIVLFNASKQDKTIELEPETYTVICANGMIDENGIRNVTDRIKVKGQSATILKI